MALVHRLKRHMFLALVMAGLPGLASAVSVGGLYSVQVPVEGSSPEELNDGYRAGLEEVFLRVSGSADVLDLDGVGEVLDGAESLVQSYQFRRGDDSDGNRLEMTFGAVGVNRALASIDAPVWGANRPLTLAWVAVEDNSGRRLVTTADDADGGWSGAFNDAAAERGLPLVLPPDEMADRRRLLSEVWGQFLGPVEEASGDLDHDLLGLVKVSRRGSRWEAAWTLQGSGFDESEERVTAEDQDTLAQRVAGAWADLLADRYAVAAGEVDDANRVDIVVDQVDGLDDYSNIQRALEDMTPIVGSEPVRVTRDQLTLRLAFSGEVEQVEEYIALDQRFVRQRGQSGDRAAAAEPESPERQEVVSLSEAGEDEAGDSQQEESLFQYQPLEAGDEESERSFENLYETLRYRWQGAPVVDQEVDAE